MKAKIAQFLILCILFTMVLPLNVWAAHSMTFAMDENYVNGNIYSSVRGVMSHQGNYVAWGQYGNIQTSSDGIKWTSGNNTWNNDSVAGNLYNIVYNDVENKYVGIGNNCYASSLDGENWESEASSQNINNNDLLYANGNYYGVSSGYGGHIQKSTDGKNWRDLTTGLPNSNVGSTNYYNLSGIAYGNGKYIVVGSQGKVLTSNDGESWSAQTLEVGPSYRSLIDVIYAGGKYVIVGKDGTIYTSDDGISWTKRNSGLTNYDNLCSISYGDGKYVVVGGSKTLTSPDGINWSSTSTNIRLNNSICFDNSGFVTTSGIIYHSSDGISWTKVDKPSSQTISYISDLQFLNGQYVAVGNGFMISLDGVAWTRNNDNEVLNRISYGNGKYVGIGTSKTYSTIVKTSTDGVTWQPQTVNTTDSLWKADITYGGGKFVLVGKNGLILYSIDGINWTKSVSGVTSYLRSVLFVNGRFIAVGDNGTILYSSNGETWTPASSGLSSTDFNSVLWNLEYGNGQIVAVGSNYEKGSISYGGNYYSSVLSSVILSSSDGITWTKRTSPTTSGLEGVSYGNGRFIAIGDAGIVLSSTDGAAWKTESSFTTGKLGMIASNGSGFLIGRYIEFSDLLFRSTSVPTTEMLTVSNQATTGFTVTLNPALAGLTASNFTLLDSSSYPVTITGATTLDNGATYAISAALSAGKTYTVTAAKANYTFGTPAVVEVIAQFKAKPVVQIGINPNDSDSLGVFIGLDNVKNSSGNTIANPNVAGYQIEVVYDQAILKIPDVVNETNSGQFTKTIDSGKVTVTYTSATGTTSFNKLFFIPITLTDSAIDRTSLQTNYISVTDINHNQISVENPTDLVFQRGKILNEGPDKQPNTNDAVAGLQYLAGLINAGAELDQVNLINMASIMGPDIGSTIIKANVKDIIVLMQYLVHLRDPYYSISGGGGGGGSAGLINR